MAKVNNPVKSFQFNILIPGINPFTCQKVKSPDIEFDVAEHGDTNFLVKTAGIQKISSVIVEKIQDAIGVDIAIKAWQLTIGNTKTGGGLPPVAYKKNIVIQQLGQDGFSVIRTWICEGAWPQKRNGIDFDRKSSENTMESIEFQTDEVMEP